MASNRERWNDRSYRVLAVVALGLLMTGTVAFRLLEGWSWVDSFYFSVVVLVAVEIIQSGYTRKLNAERRTHSKLS